MTEVSSHPPGTFCWPELATTDQKGAVAFYRDLFGWEVSEQPIGPTEIYSMFRIHGKEIGAAYQADTRLTGPTWKLEDCHVARFETVEDPIEG